MKVADAFRQLANFGHPRVADNQKICAAHYEPQVDRAAAFKFDTGIERFRSVIKSLSEIRSVKTHDSAESFSGATCQEPQPQSPDRVFALQPSC
jgi:hypothetical protein